MPDKWARYIRHSERLLVKPGQHRANFGEIIAQTIMSRGSRAGAEACSEYKLIVRELKILLSGCEVLGDDPNHKSVVLERRHWADAIFDIENSAIRHGDQRWTNVEVRPASHGVVAPSVDRRSDTRGGARPLDDTKHITEYRTVQKDNPKLTVRSFVLKHDKEIEGATIDAKVRRQQKKNRTLGLDCKKCDRAIDRTDSHESRLLLPYALLVGISPRSRGQMADVNEGKHLGAQNIERVLIANVRPNPRNARCPYRILHSRWRDGRDQVG